MPSSLSFAPLVMPAAPLAPDATSPRTVAPSWSIDLGHNVGGPSWWAGVVVLTLAVAGLVRLGVWATPSSHWRNKPYAAPADPFAAAAVGPLSLGSPSGWRVPMTPAATVLHETPEKPRIEFNLDVGPRDSITSLLRRTGASTDDKTLAQSALRSLGLPLTAYPQTSATIVMGRRATRHVPRPLESLTYRATLETRVEITRGPDGFNVQRIAIPVYDKPIIQNLRIGHSLYGTARRAGVPDRVIGDLISALRYSLDFERDILGQDQLTLLFDRQVAADGLVRTGGLLYVHLLLKERNKSIELLRFAPKRDRAEFFYTNGTSVRALLMKTPIDGARQTSGFGWRLHPILGYSRMHQGVDFAASSGTPIQAAGTGVVSFAGWRGGHGKTVMIRHQNGIETLYGHMSAINVFTGQRVAQGQTIGAVGSTGLSTGPHLHYEVHVGKKPVNPHDARLPIGRRLDGRDMGDFRALLAKVRNFQASKAKT